MIHLVVKTESRLRKTKTCITFKSNQSYCTDLGSAQASYRHDAFGPAIRTSRCGGLVRLERPSRKRKVAGSIPGSYRQKSFKLIVVTFPLGTQDYGNSTTTGQPVSG